MLRHSLGMAVIFISLQHFIAPFLDLMSCSPSRQRIKNQFWGIFQVETLFQKLWTLLYKKAELDSRLTKQFMKLTPELNTQQQNQSFPV